MTDNLHLHLAIVAAGIAIGAGFLRARMREEKPNAKKLEMTERFKSDWSALSREIKESRSRKDWLDLEIEIDTFCWYYQNHIAEAKLDQARSELYAVWYAQEARHRPSKK